MKRVIIIGTTGSGKTTLAKKLAKKLNCPHIQIDALFWKPNWQEASDEELFSKLKAATSGDSWVVDGNYIRTRQLTWTKADTIIWINLPFYLTFYQNFTRSFRRALTGEELWEGTGNRESFQKMFSSDSILIWLFKTYWSQKKRNEQLMNDPELNHVSFYRLKSRSEIKSFLST